MIDAVRAQQATVAFGDVSLRDARLSRLLEEPLTRPLGSMLSARCIAQPEGGSEQLVEDKNTLVQAWSERQLLMSEDPMPVESLSSTALPLSAAEQAFDVERRDGTQLALPRARKRSARPSLPVPSAPPRSSALFAGIVDGWERLPSRPNRLPGPLSERCQVWATAAVVAMFSMLMAFALTLHLAPRAEEQPDRPGSAPSSLKGAASAQPTLAGLDPTPLDPRGKPAKEATLR